MLLGVERLGNWILVELRDRVAEKMEKECLQVFECWVVEMLGNVCLEV